jgi:CRP-like cAMP-binding protein
MTAYYLAFNVKPGHKIIIPLSETTTIGRDENNDIVLPDPTISRTHARIIFTNANWAVEDLGSANGIIVQDRRLARAILSPGDTYSIGITSFRFIEENKAKQSDQLFQTAEIVSASFENLSLIAEEERAQSLSERLRDGVLAVPFLSSLWEEEIWKLTNSANLHVFGEGETIISQGDPGRSIYVVLAGRVRVLVRDHYGRAHELATLETGDFFGEMSFFTGESRSADVATLVTSWLMEISYSSLQELIEEHPPVKKVLMKYHQDRLGDTEKKLTEKGLRERKQLARLKDRLPVNLVLNPQTKIEGKTRRGSYKGFSLDMSMSGIDVVLAKKDSNQFQPQTQVYLEIVLPSPWGLLRAEGHVREIKPARVKKGLTLLSIEFVNMTAKDSQKLKEFFYGDTHEGL